jgi:AcrR family transcriptional regulator
MEEKPYHHGTLKTELISKGLQLLAAEGYEGFSMRKLAAMCGVSHAAPYKHFKNREEIISAIVQAVSEKFSSAIEEAIGQRPGQPRRQIIDMGKAYVCFMVNNPDYFKFMFMIDHGRPIPISRQPGNPTEQNTPLAMALGCAQEWFGRLHPDDWFLDFMGMWSLLHGFTLMLISGTVRCEGDFMGFIEEMLERYLDDSRARQE